VGLVAAGIVAATTSSDSIAHWLRDQSFRITPQTLTRTIAVVAGVAAAVALAGRTRRGRRALAGVQELGRAAGRAASRAPPVVVLTGIVVLASVVRISLGTVEILPRVLGDELVYSGLAKGIALDGVPALRGVTSIGYSLLVPLAWAPGYALASTGVGGYEVVKAVNAIAFAAAAVPTYALARRIASQGWALVAAALAVLAPWGAYSALAMTESLFYLGFVVFALALVLSVERPTALRQLAALAAVGALIAVRPQALALVGAVFGAYALHAVLERRVRQYPSTYWVSLLTAGAVALGALGLGLAGVELPGGAYGPLLRSGWGVFASVKWALWNVAAIAAAFGVVALVVLPLALRRLLSRGATSSERAVGVVVCAATAAVLVSVAVLSASPYGLGVLHERNLFYVAPLVLVCFVSWLPHGDGRRSVLAACSAAAVVVLALLLPGRLVERANNVDSPTAILVRELGTLGVVRPALWLAGLAVLAALAVLAGRSVALLLVAVLIGFAGVHAQMDYEARLDLQAGKLDWVDRSLPDGARATLLNVGSSPADAPCAAAAEDEQQQLVVWTEFLNTRVDRVLRVLSPSAHDNLASPELTMDATGLLRRDGRPVEAGYVVADSRQRLAGRPVARLDLRSLVPAAQGASLTLWSVGGPLRLTTPPGPLPPRPDGAAC
jgi:hypothetical protein